MDYGRQLLGQTGIPIEIGADETAEYQPIGIAIDWTTVAAVGADTIAPEGFTVKAGQKWLRFGQVLCKITNPNVQTITVTATGGTMILYLIRPDTGATVNTGAVAYNVSAANLQAAINGVMGAQYPSTVGLAGGVYTITTPGALQPIIVDGTALTGGTATQATTTAAGNYGKFGPYDAAATDGRQNLYRGLCGLLKTSVVQTGILGFTTIATDHPPLIVGGRVWLQRVLQAGRGGTASLAAGPELSALEAALPRIAWAGVGS